MTCNGIVVVSQFLGEYFHPYPLTLCFKGQGEGVCIGEGELINKLISYLKNHHQIYHQSYKNTHFWCCVFIQQSELTSPELKPIQLPMLSDLSPLPSLVLALRSGGGWGGGSGEAVAAETCSATAAAAAAAAAATAVAEPLNGLLELNSLHLAPRMVIILDIGILGFFLAIMGLQRIICLQKCCCKWTTMYEFSSAGKYLMNWLKAL